MKTHTELALHAVRQTIARILAVALCSFGLATSARAAFPTVLDPSVCTSSPCYEYSTRTPQNTATQTPFLPTRQAACDRYLAQTKAHQNRSDLLLIVSPGNPGGECYVYLSAYAGNPYSSFPNWGTGLATQSVVPSAPRYICPANAKLVGTQCVCKDGYAEDPETGNRCVPLNEKNEVQAQQDSRATICKGNPIYPLTGAKREFVQTEVSIGGLDFILTYDTTGKLPANRAVEQAGFADSNVLGALWKSSLHHILQVSPNLKKAHFTKGDGTILGFDGNGAGVFTGEAGNPNKLVSISGGYRYTDIDSGDVETFDTAGKLQSIATRRGQILTYTYNGDLPVKIRTAEGRELTLSYSNELLSQVTAPDGRVLGFAYDSAKNLTSITWSDAKVRGFVYENSALPWALTGVVDENGSRRSTFAYDGLGRAISTEYAGGVSKFSVTYAVPPQRHIVESFDSVNKIMNRTQSWQMPSGITVTESNGQSVAIQATAVRGQPAVSAQSQAAGSGCSASTQEQTYDATGNVASTDDFSGQRTCYAYDANNRETVRVEGLSPSVDCSSVTGAGAALPSGARKILTTWHSDWKLPVQLDEPGRRTTTVYNGQPDPFSGNVLATCTTAPPLPDGNHRPLICKQVEQALLGSGSVDTAVPARISSFSYDARGRLLAQIDPNGKVKNYSYYATTGFTVSTPGQYDPEYSAVTLLLRGDGGASSQSILDRSAGQLAVNVHGNAQISAAQSKFGGTSLLFDGVGDHLSTGVGSEFHFGAGDFTIEAWVRAASMPASNQYDFIISMDNVGVKRGWSFLVNGSNGALQFSLWTSNTQHFPLIDTTPFPINQWVHVAAVRSGSLLRLYRNGIMVSSTSVGTASGQDSNTAALIGTNRLNGSPESTGAWNFNGYIDDLRITKGKARYTTNFTPPTAEFASNGPILSPNDVGRTIGDLQSITNAAGHVTQFTQYDRAGRVRQMIDPKGVVTDISYTPRGWVSSVTTTAPGASARTTSYSYDGVGQMTGVSNPDGSTLSYSYDAAHRLVGVTDAKGNSIRYTLDNAGNRTSEEIKDPSGVLQRSITRSFDALNRVQQVTGAAQ
jgi:YD repeat-containing protein